MATKSREKGKPVKSEPKYAPSREAVEAAQAPEPQEKVPVNVNDVPDLVDSGFIALCDRYRELSDQIKDLEAEKKELSGLIMPLMEATECDAVESDRWLAVRARGTSTKIVPELLLKNGVTMQTIKDSTTTKHYFYVQVRGRAL